MKRHPLLLCLLVLVLVCSVGACGGPVSHSMALPDFTPPQLPAFTCVRADAAAPAFDAEVVAWHRSAQSLLDRGFPKRTDFADFRNLERRAAARAYWPAIMALIDLRSKSTETAYKKTAALEAVEHAMQLGIPAAFQRMGTFYAEGKVVPQQVQRAQAFWLRAAQMGDPEAQVALATIVSTKPANTVGTDLINIPVAQHLLECALGQGYAPAALRLAWIVHAPKLPNGDAAGLATPASEARALAVLQQGVRLGCADCAGQLALTFRAAAADSGHPEHALRFARYQSLSLYLRDFPRYRLPNLDAVVPLPPAPMPEIDAATGIDMQMAIGCGTAGAHLSVLQRADLAEQVRLLGRYHLCA